MAIRDMVARHSDYSKTLDLIPTPPYATRALFEHVAPRMAANNGDRTIWDPACGYGHMCDVFKEYGYKQVLASDIEDHGYAGTRIVDFSVDPKLSADAIVTNPPYALMNKFIMNGLGCSNTDFALLTRVQVLEGQRRYDKFFKLVPPTKVAVFSDRIPFKTGKVVKKASKMFTHVWLYWDVADIRKNGSKTSEIIWIPPTVQADLEKAEDYD